MTKSTLQNYRKDSTKRPAEEKENVFNITQVQFNVPQNNNEMKSKWCPITRVHHEVHRNDNEMQSKWKRKVVNRATIKSKWNKQTTMLMEAVEVVRWAATGVIEQKLKRWIITTNSKRRSSGKNQELLHRIHQKWSFKKKHQMCPLRFRRIIKHRRECKRLPRNQPKIIEGIPKCIWRGEKATDIIKYPYKLREDSGQRWRPEMTPAADAHLLLHAPSAIVLVPLKGCHAHILIRASSASTTPLPPIICRLIKQIERQKILP